ncbi:MAG TPA: hypothetical protein VG983_00715 [Caulobacterales bacterium]|nr:hypothetical protein [Caulobacterales bacterium]
MKAAPAFAAIAACALISVAAAAVRDPVDGAWSFKTGAFDNGCVLTGQLMVQPKAAGGAHACKLKARETCPALKQSGVQLAPAIDIIADETCTLTEKNGRVIIQSKVVSAPAMPYLPDNFDLQLKDSGRMEGDFLSTEILAKAVFFRGPDIVS